MTALMIRYEAAEGAEARLVDQIRRAFSAVEGVRPAGVIWRYWRVAGTNEMVAILDLAEGVENPLPGIDEARTLQALVAEVAMGMPPVGCLLELVAAYEPSTADDRTRP